MRRLAPAAVALLLTFSCTPSDPLSQPATGATPNACPAPTPPTGNIHVRGLIAPPDTQFVDRRPTGKRLIRVKAYVEMTPLEVFAFYRSLKRKKGYKFFLLENEVIEAEAFFTDGKHRNYVTARTLCPGRSNLFIFVAPEDYSATKKRKG